MESNQKHICLCYSCNGIEKCDCIFSGIHSCQKLFWQNIFQNSYLYTGNIVVYCYWYFVGLDLQSDLWPAEQFSVSCGTGSTDPGMAQ